MSPSDDFEVLVKGLNSWNLPNGPVPCELLLVGEAAFPVLVNKNGQVFIAASHYGQGRMIVMSHEGYLQDNLLTQFLCNAVGWLNHRPGAAVGVHTSVEPLADILRGSGMVVQTMHGLEDSLGVYCINAYDDRLAKEMIRFVKNGGGLLMGGQAWYWASQHGCDKVLSNFPGNQVTSVAGVYFTDAYGDTAFLKVSKKVPKIPLTVRFGEDLSQDQHQLLNGITELDINTGGLPSQLLVHGALAFPLGLNSSLDCFLAAARYGRGRVVLAAHEGMLSAPALGPFLCNAVTWLAGGQTGRIGVNPNLKNLCSLVSDTGLKCSLESHLATDLSVYCCSAYNDQEARKLHEFVAEGGGLLIGGQAWWWASQNPGKPAVADYPGNHILNPFGLSILDYSLKSGRFPVHVPGEGNYHFRSALSQFQDEVKGSKVLAEGWQSKLRRDCGAFLKIPAEGIPAYASLHRVLRKILKQTGLPHVSQDHPVHSNSCEATLLCVATELAQSGTDCFSLVHRATNGTCPSQLYAPGPPVTLEINDTSPDVTVWVSTGLYLPEGFTVNIMMPCAATSGLQVQIGCHSDNLHGAQKLCRAPVVIHRCCLDRPELSVSSLWGGLIYILVPNGSKLGPVSITITGAVPAPYFKLGETSLEEWKSSIRHRPVPWGELATDNIILTVPSEHLQDLEDPEPVLHLWDEMMGAVAKLASISFPFSRPERIVADVQISAGWMHSGYPIMCHKNQPEEIINEKRIRSSGIWGPIHELGHNQQRQVWEFPPHTTEATCNLWSVYVHETVLGIPRSQAHPALAPSDRETRVKEYLRKGTPLKEWSVWTALETYLQLQEAFGWEPFTQIFTEYQTLSGVPNNNAGKMNLWVKQFSHQVQRNLAPFFQTWGWPIEEEVAASLACLPEWQENPMNVYLLMLS
ncbi:TRPM8 channel-associated factor 2-like isoform X1 [Dromiciops gliroides]|uniref:TRPM8 channel-associated factor 2-like isoform X1 n=1 Tax=Dromiciops gliroides TaxID=33562 RepID=UPI001CC7B71C|nr:TRPM8 channel-associated factor 2-like isoform X1 [Dromiciops gliroides]XP_043821122.1 TRPM8 channel-associated factor 2-like isoform X1 [Dromiciops gliroides]